jgi:hypothetical protein
VPFILTMPDNDDVTARLDRLLRESAALRETSEQLAKEAQRLRAEIEGHQAPERRKKPRMRGK